MSAEVPGANRRAGLPAPWTQECPRSLRLEPGALHVPAATLRVLLKAGPRLNLRYAGFGFEPVVRHGDVVIAAPAPPVPGVLAVCDWDGYADLLRLDRVAGGWTGSIDGLPGARRSLHENAILALVTPEGRAGPRPAGGDRVRLALRWPAARWFWRRIANAPSFGAAADDSVREKYDRQVADYLRMQSSNLTEEQIGALGRHVRPPGRVLVAGAGSGAEVIHLARGGYRVTGFDVLPAMVDASRRALDDAGVEAEILAASLDEFDPGDRRFGAIYFTPLLYSFLAGRDRRIAMLRRLAAFLDPGGGLMLSEARPRGPIRRTQIGLAWLRRRLRGDRFVERGDWYTMYLAPDGSIGFSFLHLFPSGQVEAELHAAGYRSVRRLGGHVIATLSP